MSAQPEERPFRDQVADLLGLSPQEHEPDPLEQARLLIAGLEGRIVALNGMVAALVTTYGTKTAEGMEATVPDTAWTEFDSSWALVVRHDLHTTTIVIHPPSAEKQA